MQKSPANDSGPLPASKTRRKQEMHALQDIGEQLIQLDSKRLAELDLPETLADAILEARQMRKHGALRRQMQFIGKLMRNVDAAPIQEKLDGWSGLSSRHTAWLHLLERWRERLLADEKALGELGQKYPSADLQQLQVLTRNAERERLASKPPKSFRMLFQALQKIIPEGLESMNNNE